MNLYSIRRVLARILTLTLLVPLLATGVLPASAPSAQAAANLNSASMELVPISWNVVGLDSNNVNVGPNLYPVGAKLCNKTGSNINPTLTWRWHDIDATALNITGPTRYTVTNFAATASPETLSYTDLLPANECIYAFWSVQVTRASASYFKTRKFSISASASIGGSTETVNTDSNIALQVEKLVSQARNDVISLNTSGSLTNLGDTATITLVGKTSTAYEQLTVWPVIDLSVVRIRSMNFTFSNDASLRPGINSPLKQIYADACGWNFATYECDGDGKVGGDNTVTMVLQRVAAGNFGMAGVIYDLSGSSYHYNSDYGTDGVLSNSAVQGGAPVGVNVAVDDNYSTPYNTVLRDRLIGENDIFKDAPPAPYYKLVDPVTGVTPAGSGVITGFNTATGAITFAPAVNFRGTATFDYQLCTTDGATPPNLTSCSDPATVSISIGVQAFNDEFSVDYQGSLLASTSVKSNDFYNAPAKWQTTSAVAVTGGGPAGTLTFADDGTFSYVAPSGYSGTATFTYRLCAPDCGAPTDTSTATVTIYIGPSAVNDSYVTYTEVLFTENLSKNDIKPAVVTYSLVDVTNARGTVTLDPTTGLMTYRSSPGFIGTAVFTYNVCDTEGMCSNATVTIQVVLPPPPAPIIQWSNPASIQYPTPLTATQLNAVAICKGIPTIPGTYSYNQPLGTVLPVGTHTLSVTWTPMYPNDCTSLSTTVTIIVTAPAAPTISWPNPANQVGPYTLGPTELNAVCSVPGTLTYDPAAGTVLQPGTYTLKVTCTPTNSNYPPVSTQVTFTVTKPTATIIWNDPAPVAGPYTIDPALLNAVCSVPGTLTYDPAAGSVLQPGTYTLKVTCTPSSSLYNPVSTTVTLRVISIPVISIPLQVIPGVSTTSLVIPSSISSLSPVITSLCNGISSAVIQSPNIAYTPVSTFSGRTCINVRVTINGMSQIVQMPILVNPVAPEATKEPVTFIQGLIKWSSSPSATGYKVEIRGVTICQTTGLSCEASQTVGPATPVLVTALGNDDTSTTVEAKYIAKKVLAFTVYFDVAKFNLKPSERAVLNRVSEIIEREGFSSIFVDGHTDSSPYDNQTLSRNRARTTLKYVLERVSGLSAVTTANSSEVPAASNESSRGKTLNRRAEGYVY